MTVLIRGIAALVLLSSSTLVLLGQTQTYTAMNVYACDADVKGYKTLIIDGSSVTLSAGATQYANGDKVLIVVTNVNPFAGKYTLQLKKQPVQDLNVGDFLSSLGGIVTGFIPKTADTKQATTPAPSPPPSGAREPKPAVCNISIQRDVFDPYNDFSKEQASLHNAIGAITQVYATDGTTYQKDLSALQSANQCKIIQSRVEDLRKFLFSIESPDEVRSEQLKVQGIEAISTSSNSTAYLTQEVQKLGVDAVNVRAAVLKYRNDIVGDKACQSTANTNDTKLKDIMNVIDKTIGPSSGIPELQALFSQVDQLKTQYAQLGQTREGIDQTLAQFSNPFLMTQYVSESQTDVDVTLTVAPIGLNSSSSNKQPNLSPQTPSTPQSQSANKVFEQLIHFGYGSRFGISGGIAVSNLEKRQFTTANNKIAYQDNSNTRILPMALLHARIIDCDSSVHDTCFLVPQLSFGITAKSDDKGTTPEYLLGPSWALAAQKLFLTFGAYAGEQQRLLGGLSVGQTTTLSAANLPVAKEYHWRLGFALSWKLK
ncbi:MAG TPA: hypothetical protein VHV29_13930 [Terriglobales bacterium]|nr:hypothetical protein [Terriglobales bacterium]